MSLVTQERWKFWLGDMPMPDDATDEMMWAALGVIESINRQEEAVEGIALHSESLARYEKQLEEARAKGRPTETLQNIIKLTNEIIETYRSWLT